MSRKQFFILSALIFCSSVNWKFLYASHKMQDTLILIVVHGTLHVVTLFDELVSFVPQRNFNWGQKQDYTL